MEGVFVRRFVLGYLELRNMSELESILSNSNDDFWLFEHLYSHIKGGLTKQNITYKSESESRLIDKETKSRLMNRLKI